MSSNPLTIGIDLGGTKISTGLVDAAGNILAHDYRATRAKEGQEVVVRRMVEAARQVMAEADVTPSQTAAVGVGAPGPMDLEAGVVVAPPNLQGWKRVPLKRLIEDELGLETFLENDANAAALGEHRFGAGRGVQHMIYVTVSTGVGGGMIFDGKLYHGDSGMAGEIGHITILPNGPLCGCGNRGCLEALASGTAIAARARERIARGASTLVAEMVAGDLELVSAKIVAQAAQQGDVEAQEILTEAMTYLGIGMANLVNLFNPQLIVIGGGLINLGEKLFGAVRRGIVRHAMEASASAVEIAPAELGDKVGVLGAAAVALSSID